MPINERWLDPTSVRVSDLPERITSDLEVGQLGFVRDVLIDCEEPTDQNLRICETISDLIATYYRECELAKRLYFQNFPAKG
jgi:hypothetical protein